MSLLEIEGLSCFVRTGGFFGAGGVRRQVLDQVHLTIQEGSIVGLMGESGSGKSTLARCICGLQEPDAGNIVFDGVNIFPGIANRDSYGLAIQMLFQGGGAALNPRMTISSSLAEALRAAGIDFGEGGETVVRSHLSSVGLRPEILRKFPRELSGGEQQRVALARSLIVEPRLLVLDEPTAGIDALTQSGILYLIRELSRKKQISILYITHDLPVATSLCDAIVHLREGSIVQSVSSR